MTKEEFKKLVEQVKKWMSERDFDLVFWVVSSHGGIDHFGEFFLDTNCERYLHYYKI